MVMQIKLVAVVVCSLTQKKKKMTRNRSRNIHKKKTRNKINSPLELTCERFVTCSLLLWEPSITEDCIYLCKKLLMTFNNVNRSINKGITVLHHRFCIRLIVLENENAIVFLGRNKPEQIIKENQICTKHEFFCSSYCVIVRVRVVLKRTVVGDWRFDNLSRSHLQCEVVNRPRVLSIMAKTGRLRSVERGSFFQVSDI